MSNFSTADICDEYSNIQIAKPIFKMYGKRHRFMGRIRTVVAIEDNSYVKKMLDTKVSGDVMVIDGNGSLKCALLGDNLAKKAHENGWAGFIIYGCIRDSKIIETIDIGIKAIGTMPVKSLKKDVGEYGKDLNFAGIVFRENEYVYSDDDGIITSENIIKVL